MTESQIIKLLITIDFIGGLVFFYQFLVLKRICDDAQTMANNALQVNKALRDLLEAQEKESIALRKGMPIGGIFKSNN